MSPRFTTVNRTRPTGTVVREREYEKSRATTRTSVVTTGACAHVVAAPRPAPVNTSTPPSAAAARPPRGRLRICGLWLRRRNRESHSEDGQPAGLASHLDASAHRLGQLLDD